MYVLTIQFGEEPPVFSKVSSTRHPTQQPTPTNAYTPDQSETSWSGSTATNQGLGHPPYPTGQSKGFLGFFPNHKNLYLWDLYYVNCNCSPFMILAKFSVI